MLLLPAALLRGDLAGFALIVAISIGVRLGISQIARSAIEWMALFDLGKTIVDDNRIRIFIPQDYFTKEIPAVIWDDPTFRFRPFYFVLYAPSAKAMFSISLHDLCSLIVFNTVPERMNPIEKFYFLHELGHIGPHNRRYSAGLMLVALSMVWQTALTVCLVNASLAALVFACAAVTLATIAEENGTRLEAEVRADHFSIIAALHMQIRGEPDFARRYSLPTRGLESSDWKDPFHDPEVDPPPDRLIKAQRYLDIRHYMFRQLRGWARRGQLPQPAEAIEIVRKCKIGGLEPILKAVPAILLLATPTLVSVEVRGTVIPAVLLLVLLTVIAASIRPARNAAFRLVMGQVAARDQEGTGRVVGLFNDWLRASASVSSASCLVGLRALMTNIRRAS